MGPIYGLPMWKPDGDPGANHIIYQMDSIWQNHMEGIWVSYDFAIGDLYQYIE